MNDRPGQFSSTSSDFAGAKTESLRLLARREHSRKEIRHKLTLKGFGEDDVVAALDELQGQDWQSDARFAESYARLRSKKGFGPVRIAFELDQRGIDKETVAATLASDQFDWAASLLQVYHKKYPDFMASSLAERGKRYRFLLQRGFSPDMINDVL